jgi:spore maturation protein CgeB
VSGAKTFLKRHPDATYDEVFDRCFKDAKGCKSGKAISSRHFEPIGTKTCQILIEGRYNDILKPNEHYISVKADLSDIGEAVRRFKDVAFRQAMVETAYDYVRAEHTYAHRVRQLLTNIGGDVTVARDLTNAGRTIRRAGESDAVTVGAQPS